MINLRSERYAEALYCSRTVGELLDVKFHRGGCCTLVPPANVLNDGSILRVDLFCCAWKVEKAEQVYVSASRKSP